MNLIGNAILLAMFWAGNTLFALAVEPRTPVADPAPAIEPVEEQSNLEPDTLAPVVVPQSEILEP
jgi:hypothetical protein